MTAGGGAAEQARRYATTAEELRRKLEHAERLQRSWEAGAEGERLVAKELQVLESTGWVVLHDVHWPGRQRANVDHIAVGPGGVVVVDSKNWSGDVKVWEGRLRQNGRGRDTAVNGVAAAVAAVTAYVPAPHRSTTLGLLCLAGHDLPAERLSNGVIVVGRSQLVATIGARPQVLTPAEVAAVVSVLRVALAGPVSPTGLTTAALPAAPAPVHEPSARARRQRRQPPPLVHPAFTPAASRSRGGARPRAGRTMLRVLLTLVLAYVALAMIAGMVRLMFTSIAPSPMPPPSTVVDTSP